MVNNLSFNGTSLDFANANVVVALLLLTNLKLAAALYTNDEASAKAFY